MDTCLNKIYTCVLNVGKQGKYLLYLRLELVKIVVYDPSPPNVMVPEKVTTF